MPGRSGGDEGFGNTAADHGGGELFVADEAERVHDPDDGAEEAEQRGEGDEGPEHPLPAFRPFDFGGGAE